MDKTKLIGQADQAQIDKWKREFPSGIYAAECEGHIVYFREPLRHDINKSIASASEEEPLASLEKFMELTMIGGSTEAQKIDLVWIGIGQEVKHKMRGKEAKLVNL